MEINKLEVLDCTTRDGGYVNDWNFPLPMVVDTYRRLSKAGVDYVEVGFRDADPNGSVWRRCPEEILKQIKSSGHGAGLAVMVDFGKAGSEDFLDAADSPINLIRIAAHRNNVPGALCLIEKLKGKGYLTSMQLMGYPQYTDAERAETCRMLADSAADYVYVADSYGSLLPEQVRSLLEPLLELNRFKVGFHPHNNLQLAFANTLEAIKTGVHIVDSTLYGMGRGAGNLPTETLLAYLQQQNSDKYNLIHALLCVDLHLLPIRKKFEWGYQLPFMLSGICECHPNYSKAMIDARRYSVDDVWRALSIVKRRKPLGFDRTILKETLESGIFEYDSSVPLNIRNMDDEQHKIQSLPEKPAYLNRYPGRTFLVLANGPGLRNYHDEIQAFIEKNDPVILGANYLGELFEPHYHAFVNKKRFMKYCECVSPNSRLLLSPYFSQEFVREYTDREFEAILFRQGSREHFSIDNGIISNDCTSVSMLLVAVAIIMGAGEVFIAGMDGYVHADQDGSFYFYKEEDATDSLEFNVIRQKWSEKMLETLDTYMINSGLSGINIITPTSYEKYYMGIRNFVQKIAV